MFGEDRRRFWMVVGLWFVAVMLLLCSFLSDIGKPWNYPKDGKFKQLSPQNDSWYLVDQRWDIKAPDKWAHFQGFAWGQQIGQQYINKYVVASVLLTLGVYKEYEDAYREGWSIRDLSCDIAGIIVGMYAYDRIFASFNSQKQEWIIHIIICKK
ncbi:MAG: hypothetical protein KAW92_10655 [Candidatus Cloacimonetes bacterium]|nr:hypothetical protein [Candidatus Cloacimonadota bacterium]